MSGVTDINVGTDWDEASLSADSSINNLGNFQNEQVTIVDEDMTSDPGFTEFGSGAGSFSYDAINDDYDIDTRRNITPHGIFKSVVGSHPLTDNYSLEFEFVPSVMAAAALSIFGLFNSANRGRIGVFYNNMVALGIAGGGGLIFYVQNSVGTLFQISFGVSITVGRTYRVVIENIISDNILSLTVYEDGVLFTSKSYGSGTIGTVTVNEFRACNAGSSTNNASIAMDLNDLLFRSDFATSAKVIETEIIGLAESFDSGDIRFKTDRVIAAGTEVKAYVKLDGGAYGSAINVNTTPVAGLTAVYQFTAGTNFAPTTNVVIKMEINSPDVDTQIEVSTPWVDGITAGAACDYAAAGDLRLGVTQDFGNITGTLAVAPPGKTIKDIPTDDTVGTYKQIPEENGLKDFQWGADGVEFTGTLETAIIIEPLEIVEIETLEVIEL